MDNGHQPAQTQEEEELQKVGNLELQDSLKTLHSGDGGDEKGVIGFEHWQKVRGDWTQNHTRYDSKFNAELEYKKNDDLMDVEKGHFDTIYHSLVTGRKFQKPMPLSFVMLVIIHGWRREGLVRVGCAMSSYQTLLTITLLNNSPNSASFFLYVGAAGLASKTHNLRDLW